VVTAEEIFIVGISYTSQGESQQIFEKKFEGFRGSPPTL